jgi:hypothetical protein
VLATYTIDAGGMPVPSSTAFQLSFVLGGVAAIVALVVALFIPRRHSAEERHPSLPE